MAKIYLKKVKGGGCPDCYCGKHRELCQKKFNITTTVSIQNLRCFHEGICYKRITKKEALKILSKKVIR